MPDKSLIDRIIENVARREGLHKSQTDPLEEAIDVDALESLIKSSDTVWVSFVYMGNRIVVNENGSVYIS